MSYGVLESLEAIDLPAGPSMQRQEQNTSKKTLLDEVNIITSVSGGSFTAAYYGLYGKDIFKKFQKEFLLRDVQSALIWRLINPLKLATARFCPV